MTPTELERLADHSARIDYLERQNTAIFMKLDDIAKDVSAVREKVHTPETCTIVKAMAAMQTDVELLKEAKWTATGGGKVLIFLLGVLCTLLTGLILWQVKGG